MVIDILKPNNFYYQLESPLKYYDEKGEARDFLGFKHAEVYKCMLEMYPRQKLDIVTLTWYMTKKYRIVETNLLGYDISRLTDRVASSANLEFHSMILVQESILRMLNSWIENKVQEAQQAATLAGGGIRVPTQSIGNEMPEEVLREKDFAEIRRRIKLIPNLFDKIDALRSFFSAYGYTEELEEVEEMASNINERTNQLRAKHFQNNQLNYVRHLAKQCNYPEEAGQLIDLALNIITNEIKPSPRLVTSIHQLGAIA